MRRRSGHRPERVAATIKESLAEATATKLKDPRVGFVTVTNVTVSPDLTHAQIWVSVMGDDDEKAQALEGLGHARGFLRSLLAQHLTLRTTPELHFHLDRGLDHASRIETILNDLQDGERS